MSLKKSYAERLKDPRWQKMRLKILERDEWCCQICFDSKETLHIHHRYYKKNTDPWDYPLESLVTLCESCHESEAEYMPEMLKDLNETLKQKFLSADISLITIAFGTMELLHIPNVIASAIEHFLSHKEHQRLMIEIYFDYLKRTKRQHLVKKNNDRLKELSHGSDTSRNNTDGTSSDEDKKYLLQ
jgi:hypothetical protein